MPCLQMLDFRNEALSYQELHQQGLTLFQNKNYEEASIKFTDAIVSLKKHYWNILLKEKYDILILLTSLQQDTLLEDFIFNEESKKSQLKTILSCRSACYLQMSLWILAESDAILIVKYLDPNFIKGYLRLYCAKKGMKNYQHAIQYLQYALQKSPSLENDAIPTLPKEEKYLKNKAQKLNKISKPITLSEEIEYLYYKLEKQQNKLKEEQELNKNNNKTLQQTNKYATNQQYTKKLLNYFNKKIKLIMNLPENSNENKEIEMLNRMVKENDLNDIIKIENTKEMGKAVFVKRNCKKGQLVFKERYPILAATIYYKDYCSYCLKKLQKRIFNCKNNCKFEFYCSEECCKLAWDKYHQFTCDLNMDLVYNYCKQGLTTSSRFHLLQIKLFGLLYNYLQNGLQSNLQNKENLQNNLPNNLQNIYDDLLFAVTMANGSFDFEKTHISPSDAFKYLFINNNLLPVKLNPIFDACFYECLLLKMLTNLFGVVAMHDHKEDGYNHHHNCQLGCSGHSHSHGHHHSHEEEATSSGIPHGISMYGLETILNHSCVPNIVGGIAQRDIQKNEQLQHSYLPINDEELMKNPWARAQALIQYGFVCDCELCNKDGTKLILETYWKNFNE
ncbi:hypothetical protein ABK040_004269 [Willaertia magna]